MTPAAPPANPLLVPSPAAAAVRERVRDALAARRPLRIVGRGSWLDAGRPVRADAEPLGLGAHDGIVEYEPGDLTLTAQAGATLDEIQRVVGAERQWLGLDPPGGGTIGATVATASYGPLAHAFGTPRDNVLGVEFVTGTAEVVRGGGRVVKNVAGFDLARLVTGAWGTLGVVTEVTVRLRPRPDVLEAVALAVPAARGALAALLDGLRAAPIAPLALELVNGPLARHLGVGSGDVVLARLGGNAELVRAQLRALAALGDAAPGEGARRAALELAAVEPPRPDAVAVRLSRRPSRLAETWEDARALAARLGGARLQASVGRGVVRVVAAADEATVRAAFAGLPRGEGAPALVAERLPAGLWDAIAPSRARDALSRGVRDAFDPHRILNPGILGE